MSIFDRLLNRERQEEQPQKAAPNKQASNRKSRKPHPRHKGRDTRGRFLPGFVANPQGRPPKERCIADAMRELGDVEPEGLEGTGWTRNKLLAMGQWLLALGGDKDAVKTVLDRTEGKVPQRQELTGREGGPIAIAELSDDERRRRILALFGLDAEEDAGQPAVDDGAVQEDVPE